MNRQLKVHFILRKIEVSYEKIGGFKDINLIMSLYERRLNTLKESNLDSLIKVNCYEFYTTKVISKAS